jgi:carbonic anhydrase
MTYAFLMRRTAATEAISFQPSASGGRIVRSSVWQCSFPIQRITTMRHRLALLVLSLLLLFSPSLVLGSEAGPGVSSDEVLNRLKEGNLRFATGHSAHPHADLARMTDTASHGQHPVVTVLSCSDSRVPVELLFDQGIGDVFVVRVAGNVCAVDELGSIEYGADHLGTPVLVVLGHTHCGAVTAVATGAEVHGHIRPLVDHIKPALDKAQHSHPELHGEALVPAAIEANVWQAIEDVLNQSPVVRQRAKDHKLKVVGAIYEIENGSVKWLGEHPKTPQLLAQPAATQH